jgi:hypothetical protein
MHGTAGRMVYSDGKVYEGRRWRGITACTDTDR